MRSVDRDTMPGAFLVLVSRTGRRLPPHLAALAGFDDPQAGADLPFAADDRLVWRDDNDRTLVLAWQQGDGSSGRRWMVDDDGLVLSTGCVRAIGRPWIAPGQWSREFAMALRRTPADEVVRGLTGNFHLLAIDRTGDGVLVGDPVGFEFVYQAANDELVAISSVASLAARVIAPPGRPAPRDPLASGWLVYAPFHIGQQTGYAGVELQREGTTVHFRSGVEPRTAERPAPWLARDKLDGLCGDDLLDHISEAIADELRATLAIDRQQKIMDLTGGMDSRLVLAVALGAGIADQFHFLTAGPESLGDVQIARRLAEQFGLQHRWGLDPASHTTVPYPDRARSFVESTAGMVSVWHAKSPGPLTDRLRVSGSYGEVLRAHRPILDKVPTIEQVVEGQIKRFHFRSLDLLDPEVVARYDDLAQTELRDDPVGDSEPLDLLETFMIRNRARKYCGPMAAMERDQRVWPLFALDTVRAAFALGPSERQVGGAHFEIMRRNAEALVTTPFVGPGWPPALKTRLPHTSPTEPPRPPPATKPDGSRPDQGADRPDGESLVALLRRESSRERDEFIRDLLSERQSPAWSVIDRARTVAAFDRWDQLTNRQRQQVHGAATAVLWLG